MYLLMSPEVGSCQQNRRQSKTNNVGIEPSLAVRCHPQTESQGHLIDPNEAECSQIDTSFRELG